MIALLNANEIGEADATLWKKPAAYVAACNASPMRKLVRNVETRVAALRCDRWLFPVTIDDGIDENSYVVSPVSAYVDYAKLETRLLPSRALRGGINAMIGMARRYLKAAQLDRMIQINNWMLSTNLYSGWEGQQLADITSYIAARHPDRAIGFRSVNEYSNAVLMRAFRDAGYILVPSRQVYIFDLRAGDSSPVAKKRNFQIDSSLFRLNGYRVTPIVAADGDAIFERIERLYSQLYLEKYPDLNPQFTAAWLEQGHKKGWLRFLLLRDAAGRIDGVLGFFENDDLATVPIVGYDITLPQEIGLYRMLTWLCLRDAMDRKIIFNFSSGAAHFKRLRGGMAQMEYSAVFVEHLPFRRRLAWKAVAAAACGIGAPLMRHYRL